MRKRRSNASVLLLTLFLILLAATALTRFTEKALSEILGEALHVERDRLRIEAFSVLETTVAVLQDVLRINGALWDPEQGWADPLEYAGLVLPEGLEARIDFTDEMGKIPLPLASRDQLILLFETLGFEMTDAAELTESYMNWIGAGQLDDGSIEREYEYSELPYAPARQPLRSFYELAAVRGFRDIFFDEQGVANPLMHRFASLASLYRFQQVNVNSASPDVLRIWSHLGDREVAAMEARAARGESGDLLYFRDLGEASAQLGIPLESNRFTVSTQCLRITISMTDGPTDFVVSTVIAPTGAAANLRPSPGGGQTPGAGTPGPDRRTRRTIPRPAERSPAQQPGAAGSVPQLNYPFTFLEIRENESVL